MIELKPSTPMLFEALAMTVAAFCAHAADVMPKAASATAAFQFVVIVFPHRVCAERAAGRRLRVLFGKRPARSDYGVPIVAQLRARQKIAEASLPCRNAAGLALGRWPGAESASRTRHAGGAMTDQLSRRDFLGVAAGTAAAALCAPRAARAQGRPNVLFILADDLGYGDLSSYGRPDYSTPVLDRLATQGMKFTSAYAAAPVCTPTRVAFMTGRYPQRTEVGLQEPLTASSPPVGLPAGQPTVASRMRAAGYETALIGKWHWAGALSFSRTGTGSTSSTAR